MIEVKRDNTKIKVNVSTDLPYDCKGDSCNTLIPFEWDEGSPYRAEMLKRYIEKRLRDWIQRERQALYEQGFKDGKGHRRKQKHFPRGL